ncbi:MAG TPA: ketopantoate reductase family protein [Burkholderiales bacterium]|jgi:2-dehydropantoate 2-reductase|nr:ketopantoate reductase family protein [Burkholderiales bacterium]
MRIHMIGAGAMGGVYGGLLKRAGHDVTLIDPRVDHIERIRREGLIVEGVRGRHVVQIPACTGPEGLAACELAIIFTDANATRDAARTAARVLGPEGCALTLQNGIGNVEALIGELGRPRVIAGVSMNSAANPEPGRVVYTNSGMTSLGELDGRTTERVREVARMLDEAGIPAEIVPDPMTHIWTKFVHNCCINALAAVTGLRGGEIYRTPEVAALQERIIDEVLAVVARKGIRLNDPDPRKKIKEHCRVRYNKPSMLQHVEQGRRTEIDALNGALLREAGALGMALPYNEALVAIVKGLEKSRRQLLHEPPRDYAKLEAQAQREGAAPAAASAARRAG